MSKFRVEIEEILQRVEEVEAKNLEEAIDIIEEKYDNQEIILDSEDFKGHEIREYKGEVRIEDLEENSLFDVKYGKAILLEGNKDLALIKLLGNNDNPYVVATGLSVSKYKTYFEWNEGTSYRTLSEANEEFEELYDYQNTQNDLIYSELGKTTLENHNIERFDNVDEIFEFLLDDEIDRGILNDMLSERMKNEIVLSHVDTVVKENGKYYFGQDLYFFEEDVNKKTRKIDKILNELNIKNVKPYDVIELLEQDDIEKIDENLENSITNSIKVAGYNKTINDFINYINEEIYKEEEEVEEEENEM